MNKKLTSMIQSWLRSLLAIGLVLTLVLGHADNAAAARGGGRMGGGSFRAPSPSRTYRAPSRPYAPPGGGYYPGGGYFPGGGFGFPFIFPVFGLGGGLVSLLIFLTVANFLVQTFRRSREDGSFEGDSFASPKISVAKLQVGLLAEGRELQADLNRIAEKADTGSSAGLVNVLQETTLALLRHPEYWMYGGATVQQTRLEGAETQFNRLALTERSKFSRETLSNVNNQLKQATPTATLNPADKSSALVESTAPGEFIVVTLLVGAQGDLKLPTINSAEEMRQALQQLGGAANDRLLALEVLWTPQAAGDVLTSEDLLVEYPDLKLI